MKTRRLLFFAVMMLALVLNACAPVQSGTATMDKPTATPDAMMDKPTATPDAMMDKPTATPDTMMDKPTATPDAMMDKPTATPDAMMDKPTPDAMMDKPTATPDAMMDKPTPDAMMDKPTATPDAMMDKPAGTPDAMMQSPTWFSVKLTDVNTGTVFSLSDFKGKVVLVETIAVGCSTCLQQQQQLLALPAKLGMNTDLVRVTLDIAPSDNAAMLEAFATAHGFDWQYALAPAGVTGEISQLYGAQFVDPASAPVLVVDRAGGVHPLALGLKSADELTKAIEPFLKSGM